ncbi:MAG: hypothetical protein ACREIT_03960 [Tepidisphaeraceae bacterium]
MPGRNDRHAHDAPLLAGPVSTFNTPSPFDQPPQAFDRLAEGPIGKDYNNPN